MTEAHLNTLRILFENPDMSQRKVNHLVNTLRAKGYIRVKSCKEPVKGRLMRMYIVTPEGIKKKMELTRMYVKLKSAEHTTLDSEIMQLKGDISDLEDR